VQVQWKRLNRWFPQGQTHESQSRLEIFPSPMRGETWETRHNCTAPSLTMQSPLSCVPSTASHHGRSAFAIASLLVLSGPQLVPADSGEHRRHHRLRGARPRQCGGPDWSGRGAGSQTALAVHDDAHGRADESFHGQRSRSGSASDGSDDEQNQSAATWQIRSPPIHRSLLTGGD
jgi:hypothetical protein